MDSEMIERVALQIHVGQTFGRLTVESPTASDKHGNRQWICRCVCGNEKAVKSQSLKTGNTRSCGCLMIEYRKSGAPRRIHGHARQGSNSREYKAYHHMRARCQNPRDIGYRLYGGRGVIVCERWMNGDGEVTGFDCFLADLGPAPSPRHSLDRIDADGNYEPGNARWATPREQVINRRVSLRVMWEGEERYLAELCDQFGLKGKQVRKRLANGWPLEKALKEPIRIKRG